MRTNGQLIRDIREAKGLTIRELAAAVNVSGAYLSRLERGLVGATDATQKLIAKCLDVPVAALMPGGEMTTPTTTADSSPPVEDNTFLYTREEAAARLRVTEDWLKKATARGEVPYTLVGRTYRYSPANLRAFIEMNEGRARDAKRRPRRAA